jgi:hypothetical protein
MTTDTGGVFILDRDIMRVISPGCFLASLWLLAKDR